MCMWRKIILQCICNGQGMLYEETYDDCLWGALRQRKSAPEEILGFSGLSQIMEAIEDTYNNEKGEANMPGDVNPDPTGLTAPELAEPDTAPQAERWLWS